jgi:tRNA(Ile)-lysidine synthase
VPTLPSAVLGYIRKLQLLKPGDRLGVAVSGGVDSVALLRVLLELRPELGVVLSAVHFNHKLRGPEADQDEQFVANLARQYKLQFHGSSGDVSSYAAEKGLGVEAAGREKRYGYFRLLLEQGRLDRIATAHTLDDQAETVLLRVVRGAGTRGLAGIYPQLSFASQAPPDKAPKSQPGAIIRPLLATRRKDLKGYLEQIGQSWREDSSNRDLRHARNRVRHGILPRLERNLNPALHESLAGLAEVARAEEAYWEQEVARLLPSLASTSEAGRALTIPSLSPLRELPLALQRRVIRAAAESCGMQLEFRHGEEILNLAPGQTAHLPGGWRVSRQQDELRFALQEPGLQAQALDYDYPLPIPGRRDVPEVGSSFEALVVSVLAAEEHDSEQLLDPRLLGKELRVRNWRAGDRFWPSHTKSPKKIKELLQEHHIAGAARKLWPVVVSGSELVWARGFRAPARFRPGTQTADAVLIRELPLKAS